MYVPIVLNNWEGDQVRLCADLRINQISPSLPYLYYSIMRVARITLEDVITRNYQNISNLDFDIKHLVNHLESESKPDLTIFNKKKSYKTIEDTVSYSSCRLSKKLSFEMVKGQNQSESQPKRKGSFIQRHMKSKEENVERQSRSPRMKMENYMDSKKLHRFLFEMDLPVVSREEKAKRTKFTIISPTTPTVGKPESMKLIKKYENEELPAFLRKHIQNPIHHTTRIQPQLFRKAMSMMKIKRKNRIPSVGPVRSHMEIIDDKGIKPDITELKVVDLKSRNERKAKTSQNIMNRKIITSLKRYHENVQGKEKLCGWNVEQ